MNTILYSTVFIDTQKLLEQFTPVHCNIFAHHSTIEFKPRSIDVQIGLVVTLQITGRLITNKVDVLIVDNPYSKNRHPHITISTAEGVKPFASNNEIEQNQHFIIPLTSFVKGVINIIS